ncbi:hypothetical protein B0T25DRAFT_565070 [Lasiosphaeria hispida]|uniref:Uncharacterized protein n=1 Tax=Lasiosphaeria hispida TaxID=260671 RepID=A0AAJ0HRI3_9PEZI|nr:hypothetical protein B0T25DRAFT_565070 [Lasiosphaeria hispida]
MPAINTALVARDAVAQLAKRGNFASNSPGVIVVFCIVFVVAAGLISLFLSRKISSIRANRAARKTTERGVGIPADDSAFLSRTLWYRDKRLIWIVNPK